MKIYAIIGICASIFGAIVSIMVDERFISFCFIILTVMWSSAIMSAKELK